MTKRNVPPADTWLADFRESAGLIPPPRTLSNAASRLVDLMDEFLYSLQGGWEIPPGFPRDRFVPTGYGKGDLVAPIVQYLDDFGFTGDARRLHEAARQFYAHRDWQLKQMLPRPGDDKGWQEFQERCVKPLGHLAGCLQGVICDVRQLIIDAAAREAATQAKGKGGRTKGSGVKLSKHEKDRDGKGPVARKRRKTNSKELTNAQELMAAVLREWHGYDGESLSVTNRQSISVRELSRRSKGLSTSTVSKFFDEWITNAEYKRLCKSNCNGLAVQLAKLSREGLMSMLTIAGDIAGERDD